MKQHSAHPPSRYPLVLSILSITILVATLIGSMITNAINLTNLQLSGFALLPASATVINSFLLSLIIRRKRSIVGAFWLGIFLVTTIIWGVGDVLTFLNASTAAAGFLRSTVIIPALIGLPAILMFILKVTGEKEENIVGTWAAVTGTSLVLLLIGTLTKVIFNNDISVIIKTFWGYDNGIGPLLDIYLLWSLILMLFTAFITIRYYRQQTKRLEKKRAGILMLGLLIPIVSTVIFQIIIPAFGISFIPIGSIAITVMGILITYGMLRYNLFVIEPTTIASNILETMAESVVVTNVKFETQYINESAKQIFGITDQLHTIEQLDASFSADDFTKIRHALVSDPRLTHQEKFEDLTIISPLSKKITSVDVSVSSVLDYDDAVAGYVFVMTDISALKAAYARLAEEEQIVEQKVIERNEQLFTEHTKLEASIASLPVGFAMLDEKNKLLELNGFAKNLLKLKGNSAKDLLKAIDELGITQQFNHVKEHAELVDIAEIELGRHMLHVIIAPIVSSASETFGTVVLIEDITKQKSSERERNEFIITASHEMRTPLAVIQGNLANALDPDVVKINKEVKPIIEDAYTATMAMSELFKDILTVSEIDNGHAPHYENKTDFELSTVLQDCVKQLRSRADSKQVALSLHTDEKQVMIHGDPNEIKEVILKLVENAIKYTPKGFVSVTLANKQTHVVVSVEDSGIGIASADRKRLFKKFARLDNDLTRKIGGTGLGLYIASHLAERNDGSVTLEHSSPKGSIFTLELPITKVK